MSAPASALPQHRHGTGSVGRRRVAIVAAATIGFHAVALLVLGSIRIYEYVKEDNAQFEAPAPPPQAVPPEMLEYKVKMQQRQADSARPALQRIQVNPLPQQALPELNIALPPPGTGPALRGQGAGTGEGLGVGRGLGLGAVAVNPRAFGTTRQLEHSWVGTIYFFSHLERLRTADGRWFEGADRELGRRRLYTYLLNVPKQSFTEGFPGISNQFEWFGIDFNAEIYWPEYAAGEWEFRLTSDDGSILQVNGLDVVDHDGQHGFDAREGRVTLNPGRVQFRLAYFQGPRTELGLMLEWRRAGTSEWKLFDLREFLPYQGTR